MSIPLALCASTIDNNNIEAKKINKLKKEPFNTNKLLNMKNAIRNIHNNSEIKTEGFADFVAPKDPEKPIKNDNHVSEYQYNQLEVPHMPLMQAYETEQKEQKYTYPGDQAQILDKLDKIIHLFEESYEGKTKNKGEELILYSFLGIFIIYVLDSFARIGKYVR
tara:strand:+ start:3929 stop:4420 length:492 start_codon:yes stop_codon:yes gene_type:complete